MRYFPRIIEKTIKDCLAIFPAVGITGPRQSGKSTTLQKVFGRQYRYVTFDDPLTVNFFESDPRGFMEKYGNKVIFDEVQKSPEIFHYLKLAIDQDRQNRGKFILAGSSHFSFVKHITESLAGRIGLLSLLPFQRQEITKNLRAKQILKGSYPELVSRKYTKAKEWYAAYVNNYIERDVRSLYNVGNLRDFQRLVNLLAARAAQELNMSVLANDLGVSVKTVQQWISILEASYIIFLLPSYHKNLGKRIVKRPKLYFYDTGLICYLTGIQDEDALSQGPMDGAVFENYVIAEVKKMVLHKNLDIQLFYFRSNLGLESDLILEDKRKRTVRFIEIKTGKTAKYAMVKNLKKLIALEKQSKHIVKVKVTGHLVYKGKTEEFLDGIQLQNFSNFLGV